MQHAAHPTATLRVVVCVLRDDARAHRRDEEQRHEDALHQAVFSDGCKWCQSLYESRMRGLAAAVLTALLVPGICQAKKPHCTVRAHAEANENDGDTFSTR